MAFESYNETKIPVIGPDDANYLYIFSGIAVLSLKGDGDDWKKISILETLPHKFKFEDRIIRISVNGALNSIENINTAHNVGWALDNINAYVYIDEFQPPFDKNINVIFSLATRGENAYIRRVSFEVFLLVEELVEVE